MEPYTAFRSRVVPLVRDDIDTDQIIPARFLKVTGKQGLGEHLFADWRSEPGFTLTDPRYAGAQVLLAGANFGCGSSREHAPWALREFGLRAVIARSFGDIFRANALKNRLLPIALDDASHARLLALLAVDSEVGVDLASETVELPDGSRAPFVIDPFAKKQLVNGHDELDYLLSHGDAIAAFETRARP